jgi:glyoxylase-like metal-dependent hydrolase (beta-lactamase superfamily II)
VTTYRKQEQEPASDEVTEVAPGLLRMQLPISMPGLGHVNCYALEDGDGFCLVDPGLPGPESWDALIAALGRAGVPLTRVHSIYVTHSHPDHFGGAAQLRDETGADIITHERFRFWWDPNDFEAVDPEEGDVVLPFERPTPWGGEPFRPPSDVASEMWRAEMRRGKWIPRPTRRLDDADVITLARRDWVAVHTPGHTPDHLCLLDPTEGVLLSGDHVLPTITPHISGMGNTEDPLAEFIDSLNRVEKLEGVTIVLPAHGHPFTDLAGRAEAIKKHHEERLDRLRHASADMGEAGSVHQYMQYLFSERAWGSMAEAETYAHLEHLRLAGQATSHWEDGLLVYDLTA